MLSNEVEKQYLKESHVCRVVWILRANAAPFLTMYPGERHLGWPYFSLFREGQKKKSLWDISFSICDLVKLAHRDRVKRCTLIHFPFTLAEDGYALKWFSTLPRQCLSSWVVEAFIARFHDYSIPVKAEQLRAMLACETKMKLCY